MPDERPLRSSQFGIVTGRLWPIAPVDPRRLDDRYRGIAAVGSVKLTGSKGSKAPIRFLNQLPFDQLLMCPSSPIFERPLCRFLHRDCDDEQRLLWPSLRLFPT